MNDLTILFFIILLIVLKNLYNNLDIHYSFPNLTYYPGPIENYSFPII